METRKTAVPGYYLRFMDLIIGCLPPLQDISKEQVEYWENHAKELERELKHTLILPKIPEKFFEYESSKKTETEEVKEEIS